MYGVMGRRICPASASDRHGRGEENVERVEELRNVMYEMQQRLFSLFVELSAEFASGS